VLKTPIFVRANADGTGVQLTGAISLSGVVPPIVASPAGFGPRWEIPFVEDLARKAA
jgi:hypothetical protein